VTILVAGTAPDDVGTSFLLRTLGRHGIAATVETMDHGAVSGRARGSALLDYTHDTGADLLVMGAYGHSRLREMILGGATRDVLSAAGIPVLMAH
jgi:nucleotide-binding universal stress UspA family protein